MNREELSQFIEFKANDTAVDLNDLALWIEASRNWEIELGCLNYLFAQILERKTHDKQDCSGLVQLLYDSSDQMYLRVHECDYAFIAYMLRFLRESDISLEEEFVRLHNNMCEHKYE